MKAPLFRLLLNDFVTLQLALVPQIGSDWRIEAMKGGSTCYHPDFGNMDGLLQLQQSFEVDLGLWGHGMKILDGAQPAEVNWGDSVAENLT